MIHGHGPILLTFLSVKGERRGASALTFLSVKTGKFGREAPAPADFTDKNVSKTSWLDEAPWRRAGFTDIFVSETEELRRSPRGERFY